MTGKDLCWKEGVVEKVSARLLKIDSRANSQISFHILEGISSKRKSHTRINAVHLAEITVLTQGVELAN